MCFSFIHFHIFIPVFVFYCCSGLMWLRLQPTGVLQRTGLALECPWNWRRPAWWPVLCRFVQHVQKCRQIYRTFRKMNSVNHGRVCLDILKIVNNYVWSCFAWDAARLHTKNWLQTLWTCVHVYFPLTISPQNLQLDKSWQLLMSGASTTPWKSMIWRPPERWSHFYGTFAFQDS